MEFPFGHNHHSHTHHHRNDDEDNRERPPPPNLHHHEFPPPSHHYPPNLLCWGADYFTDPFFLDSCSGKNLFVHLYIQLVSYKPDLDESVLWSESKEVHDGYRAIRMINNIRLNFDTFHGDKKSGGIHNGTTIVLWQWNEGDNQIWRIAP
ncbi:hypothetical protein F3Y22_tig00112738pilonHSYRG00114 [Hibiscus syriacus]|uniref:Uncharacterized protein n=1 Tax=Hibiscus syriacus TaxID=106335 RepID=A0A6A2WUM2_HIBSY|nr:hypothetical protein F3Y22_tig00112738pilonHSYRG00114 [Hibiscus syriacus]